MLWLKSFKQGLCQQKFHRGSTETFVNLGLVSSSDALSFAHFGLLMTSRDSEGKNDLDPHQKVTACVLV